MNHVYLNNLGRSNQKLKHCGGINYQDMYILAKKTWVGYGTFYLYAIDVFSCKYINIQMINTATMLERLRR